MILKFLSQAGSHDIPVMSHDHLYSSGKDRAVGVRAYSEAVGL